MGTGPRNRNRMDSESLPMLLSPEQVSLLVKLGVVSIVDEAASFFGPQGNLPLSPTSQTTDPQNCDELLPPTKKRADPKGMPVASGESYDKTIVQLPLAVPRGPFYHPIEGSPLPGSDVATLKVFEDIWKRGYYVTSGIKFGGKYLVYKGFFSYALVCISRTNGGRRSLLGACLVHCNHHRRRLHFGAASCCLRATCQLSEEVLSLM